MNTQVPYKNDNTHKIKCHLTCTTTPKNKGELTQHAELTHIIHVNFKLNTRTNVERTLAGHL